jgi:hypothetical protein
MELIKLILSEQALTDGKQGDEYKNAGYVRIAASLVDSNKNNGDIKKDNKGKFWFKQTTTTTDVDLNQYVGSYKEGTIVGKVSIYEGKLRLEWRSIDITMEPNGTDQFKFDFGGDGIVVFKKDNSGKITGFDYKWKILHGFADKITSNPVPSNPTPTPTPEPNQTSEPTQVTQYTKYSGKAPEDKNTDNFHWHDCKDKTFPFEYGCSNPLIGEMNSCIFGGKTSDVFGPALRKSLESRNFIFNGKPSLTKEMYDEIIATCKDLKEEREVVKDVVKKVLKEEIIKQ